MILAQLAGRTQIELEDIGEMTDLFLDSKRVRIILQREEGLTVAKCGNMTHCLKLSPENCMPDTLVTMHGGVDQFCKLLNNVEYDILTGAFISTITLMAFERFFCF